MALILAGVGASGVSGKIADGETITITGTGFGTKPDPDSRGTAKPVLVWKAEDNSNTPNATLGDASAFSVALNGAFDTGEFAANSSRSWKSNAGIGATDNLGTLIYDWGVWTEAYVFRRNMINHSAETGELYRTRTTDATGVVAGQWGRSRTSPNAHGMVDVVDGTTVSWDNDSGSIGIPRTSAENFGLSGNDVIDLYATEGEASSGTGTILATITGNEGTVLPFRTLNSKVIRWSQVGTVLNNFYTGDHPAWPTQTNPPGVSGSWVAVETVENTGNTSSSTGDWANAQYHLKTANQWDDEEFTFIDGTLDTVDGIGLKYKNGILAHTSTDKKHIFKSTANPDRFVRMTHQSNDNLWRSGAAVYFDYLYLDDSHCRVLIADSATLNIDSTTGVTAFDIQPCPIISWADGEIQCVVQRGQHSTFSGKYILIVDSTDTVVSSRLIS